MIKNCINIKFILKYRVITFSLTDTLQGGFQTQAILSTLHDKSKTRVDGLDGLLLLKINKTNIID